MSKYDSFPYLDVFAGAGGLGEGFSSFQLRSNRCFHAALSVERDSAACQTLMLRHFFCQFSPESVPEEYYRYIQGELSRQELFPCILMLLKKPLNPCFAGRCQIKIVQN